MEVDDSVSGASLPVDVLRQVLQHLLGDGPLEAYPLLKAWQPFALVCKAWLEVARTTPLKINLSELPELDDDVITWLGRVTVEELHLDPGHYNCDLFRHSPQFIARSGRTLRRLIGAQLSCEPADALQPGDFPLLEEIDLHADLDTEEQHFDASCLSALPCLTTLTLSDFLTADLAAAPTALRALDLFVYANEPFELPRGLQLQRLALTGESMFVAWHDLCATVSEFLSIAAPKVTLLAPEPGSAAAEAAAAAAEAAGGEGGSPQAALTAGFVTGVVAHAEVTLNWLALAAADAAVARQERWVRPLQEPPPFNELASVDQWEVANYMQGCHSRQFGVFFQPDALESEEEVGLHNGVRFELVRHRQGEPLQLGYAHELPQEQLDYLLSGVQVKRLALEHVPQEQVATILNAPAFVASSGPTLRLLEGIVLEEALNLEPYAALEELVAYVGPHAELGPLLLPTSLVHLELCADSHPPEGTDAWAEWHLGDEPPPLAAPPLLRFDAGAALSHLGQLTDLCLTAFHEMDLKQLPPSVRMILIQDPNYQELFTQPIPSPATLLLPRELPPGCTSREVRFSFTVTPPGTDGAGSSRWPPTIPLDELLGGVTHVTAAVTGSPLPPPEEEDDDLAAAQQQQEQAAAIAAPPASAVAAAGIPRWSLTVRCAGASLADVMQRVTDSPLQSITFDAGEVRFQGGTDIDPSGLSGGTMISSPAMQEYIETEWGHVWRVIPLDPAEDGEGSELLDEVELESEEGSGGGSSEGWGTSDGEDSSSSSSEGMGEGGGGAGGGGGYRSSREGSTRAHAFTLKRR